MFCVTETETLFLDATILAKLLRKWHEEIISTQSSVVFLAHALGNRDMLS